MYLSEPVAICLFRVAQEALRNILKHAQARQAKLTLRVFKEEAILKVKDDGKGLNLPINLNELTRAGHWGLAIMAKRVAWLGGQLSINSEVGAGTEVMVYVPLS